ncbi:MAG: ABC transporter ATP-binding protein [Pseudomonadota bacterium]
MILLETRGISKRFAGLVAVDNVDFALAQGEIRALIGPNGAGKTTFVGMLSGRIAPSAGRVHFAGRDITDLPAHRRVKGGIAYTFQITSVFPGLPVAENVALAARATGKDGASAAALERVGLYGLETRLAGDLSYGHQRLLEIAMGIVQSPRLLILDEPTQGLAEGEITAFKTLIRTLKAETTILLIEHNMEVVMETADQVTVLDAGRRLAEGSPSEIRANRSVQAAYLGTGNA